MQFARVVFTIAGIWGVLVITPLLFLFHKVGQMAPPPVTHAEFYFGFVIVTLMWQIAFFIIARDPARFRAMMIPPALAKFGYAALIAVLHLNGMVSASQILFATADLILGILFLIAFNRTRASTINHHLRRY